MKLLTDTTLKIVFIPVIFILSLILLCSHDLYIKMGSYFLQENQETTLSLYNGTFTSSENLITRDRMIDASVVSKGTRIAIKPEQWVDQDSTITELTFTAGEAGTYLVGVSTKARNIELTAEKFNDYLKHDGVLDVLEQRTENNLLDQDALESYQKHVKAIYQVGDIKTDDWKTNLGYPIEFIPQSNPYEKYTGDSLDVALLLDGEPLSNQLVYADYIINDQAHTHGKHGHSHDSKKEHEHNSDNGHAEGHSHTSGQQLRTDDLGIVTVDLPADGIYYMRTIHMESLSESDSLTHQSKWATLTFEVTHKHDLHDQETILSSWIFLLAVAIIVGLLILKFRKRKK